MGVPPVPGDEVGGWEVARLTSLPRYVGEVMASLTNLLLGPDGARCRAAADAITRVLSKTRCRGLYSAPLFSIPPSTLLANILFL